MGLSLAVLALWTHNHFVTTTTTTTDNKHARSDNGDAAAWRRHKIRTRKLGLSDANVSGHLSFVLCVRIRHVLKVNAHTYNLNDAVI